MDHLTVRKTFTSEKSASDDARMTITHLISTNSVDRDREVVVAKGLDFTHFKKNPIALWAHDHKALPIGKNIRLDLLASDDWEAETQFPNTPRGKEYYGLYKDGYINAWSLGFIPDRSQMGPPTDKELKAHPEWKGATNVIRKAEVVEYSGVPIPSNRDALQRAYTEKSLHLSPELAKSFELKEPALVLEHLTETQLKRAFKKAIKNLDSDTLLANLDVPRIVKERIEYARGRI